MPILTSHTIVEALGAKAVDAAVIARVDDQMRIVAGTERRLDVDTICLAVGLTPMAELALMAGCQFTHIPELGGHVPVHDERMETTMPGLYVAGDVTGIEEANTAMEEGRLAGTAIAAALGYLSHKQADEATVQILSRLDELRLGQFGEHRATAKATQMRSPRSATVPAETGPPAESAAAPGRKAAGHAVDRQGVAYTGVHCEEELRASPGYPDLERLQEGGVAVIECVQDIPCNPCELACRQGAIRVGVPITNLPALDIESCSGCGLCIAACPGLAVFVVDINFSDTEALVTFPYEFQPLPAVGDRVETVDRAGQPVTAGRVTRVQNPPAYNHTAVLSVAVPNEYGMVIRSISRWREP